MSDTRHLDLDAMNSLVDGELDGEQESIAAAHVRSCAGCGARVAHLRALIAEARALPHAVDVPDDLWSDVRRNIERPPATTQAGFTRRVRTNMPLQWRWMLAAAAVILMVASSWVTAVVVRRDAARQIASASKPKAAAVGAPQLLPASLASVEAGYLTTARELELALADQRTHLAPQTIATIEQSLRTIDEAIAEARRALATDPRNSGLIDIFTANYEQKLDLLRRAAELPASS